MKLIIELNLDNAAFSVEGDRGPTPHVNFYEVSRILSRYRDYVTSTCSLEQPSLKDINGNQAGGFFSGIAFPRNLPVRQPRKEIHGFYFFSLTVGGFTVY